MKRPRSKSQRDADRLALGAASLMSARRAAESMLWNDKASLDWLRRQGIVVLIEGRSVVIWGDIVERIRAEREAREGGEPTRSATPPGLRRGRF